MRVILHTRLEAMRGSESLHKNGGLDNYVEGADDEA